MSAKQRLKQQSCTHVLNISVSCSLAMIEILYEFFEVLNAEKYSRLY